jgi:hypothetical protein
MCAYMGVGSSKDTRRILCGVSRFPVGMSPITAMNTSESRGVKLGTAQPQTGQQLSF